MHNTLEKIKVINIHIIIKNNVCSLNIFWIEFCGIKAAFSSRL